MTGLVTPPCAVNTGYRQVLADAGVQVVAEQQFGPAGLLLGLVRRPDPGGWGGTPGSLIVTQFDPDAQVDDAAGAWLHASLAWELRTPFHSEMRMLHRAVFGRRRWAYQVHAPADRYVDGTGPTPVGPGHEHALHLWGRVDGAPAMPDFVGDRGHL